MISLSDARLEFQSDLSINGFEIPNPVFDGHIHRFSRSNKPSKNNCWYIGWEHQLRNGSSLICCFYGDWKTQEKYRFTSSTFGFSKDEVKEAKAKQSECREKYEQEKKNAQIAAAERASILIKKSRPCVTHPYLSKKKIVKPRGLRQIYNSLIAPMTNIDGELVGLQWISENGDKRFLKGQKTKGAFFLIEGSSELEKASQAYLVEGVATGFSVHEATKAPVLCALSAGNLENVCEAVKDAFPFLRLTACADNDQFTSGNPGVAAAKKVAAQFNTKIAIPEFEDLSTQPKDFNDLHNLCGIEAVRKTLQQAVYVEQEAPPPAQLADDFLLSRKLREGNSILLRYWNGDFYTYQSTHYKRVPEDDLFADVMRFLQRRGATRKKATANLANNMIANLKGMTVVSDVSHLPIWINSTKKDPRDYIALKNGLLNMPRYLNREPLYIEEHSPDFFSTVCLPYGFDPLAECPRWIEFLSTVQPDQEMRDLIQEWFGYNLVYDVTLQKFVILVGEGANGKSVVCVVLRSLLGDENVSSVNLEGFNPERTFPMAATIGKLANIVGELNATNKTAEGELKKYVTGEPMTAEEKFKSPKTFIPTARLTFATNVLPRFTDSSDGLWRRLILVPFDVQILKEADQDKNLVDSQWWIRSGELPGIFNWSLIGLKRLMERQKFIEPIRSLAAKEKYRQDSSPAQTFLRENCELEQSSRISSTELYSRYADDMRAGGYMPLSRHNFAEEVKRVFRAVELTKNPQHQLLGPRARNWIGIRFKTE